MRRSAARMGFYDWLLNPELATRSATRGVRASIASSSAQEEPSSAASISTRSASSLLPPMAARCTSLDDAGFGAPTWVTIEAGVAGSSATGPSHRPPPRQSTAGQAGRVRQACG